jgi:hypothetical protein
MLIQANSACVGDRKQEVLGRGMGEGTPLLFPIPSPIPIRSVSSLAPLLSPPVPSPRYAATQAKAKWRMTSTFSRSPCV